jgi:hypothetical protein
MPSRENCRLWKTALAACVENKDTLGVRTYDSAGVRIVENAIPALANNCELAMHPDLTIGESQELSQVSDAALLPDGGLAITQYSTSSVLLFDAKGQLIRTIGRRGDGPGEFHTPRRVWVFDDTLVISDHRPWRLQYFTQDGVYIRAINPMPILDRDLRFACRLPLPRSLRPIRFLEHLLLGVARDADGVETVVKYEISLAH